MTETGKSVVINVMGEGGRLKPFVVSVKPLETEKCLKCGNEVPMGIRYCERCGFDLFAARCD